MIYKLSCEVTVSAFTVVEADSKEEALDQASQLTIGFEFYGADPSEGWVIEEADGEPNNIQVQAVE